MTFLTKTVVSTQGRCVVNREGVQHSAADPLAPGVAADDQSVKEAVHCLVICGDDTLHGGTC